jgi:hypothetical protein
MDEHTAFGAAICRSMLTHHPDPYKSEHKP